MLFEWWWRLQITRQTSPRLPDKGCQYRTVVLCRGPLKESAWHCCCWRQRHVCLLGLLIAPNVPRPFRFRSHMDRHPPCRPRPLWCLILLATVIDGDLCAVTVDKDRFLPTPPQTAAIRKRCRWMVLRKYLRKAFVDYKWRLTTRCRAQTYRGDCFEMFEQDVKNGCARV